MIRSLCTTIISLAAVLAACSGAADQREAGSATATQEHASGLPDPIAPRFDAHQIAGRTPAEVAQILGEPSTIATARARGRYVPDLAYRGDSITIRYIDGRAEWFDVSQLDALPFSPAALSAFGIENPPSPSFANEHVIRWEGGALDGFAAVHLFPDGNGGVDYIYFNHTTVP